MGIPPVPPVPLEEDDVAVPPVPPVPLDEDDVAAPPVPLEEDDVAVPPAPPVPPEEEVVVVEVPPPEDVDELQAARRAIKLVPSSASVGGRRIGVVVTKRISPLMHGWRGKFNQFGGGQPTPLQRPFRPTPPDHATSSGVMAMLGTSPVRRT